MKNLLPIFILLVTNIICAQDQIKLRDLTFSVPDKFYHYTEQDRKFNYENFHEIGKIFTDSSDLEKFPKIQYQYFEIPKFGIQSSLEVLTGLNEIMTRDIPADTLIIKDKDNYSLSKYSIMGISMFEIKSLGKKGYINIQYSDLPNNDKESFNTLKTLISSIHHNQPYESEYHKQMKASGNYSKRAFIFFGIALAIFLGLKLIKKRSTKT